MKTENKALKLTEPWKGCSIHEKKEIALDFRYVKPSDIVRYHYFVTYYDLEYDDLIVARKPITV